MESKAFDRWTLPTKAVLGGAEYAIRSDYRAALDILVILGDTGLSDTERGELAMIVFYPDYENMPRGILQEAADFLMYFIEGGESGGHKPKQKLADWKQDFPLIIGPVNRVLGYEARAVEYLHWWTFLAAYLEIGDCFYAQVVAIRKKMAQGKKLDKQEREFYRRNKDQIDLVKVTNSDIEFLRGLEGGD